VPISISTFALDCLWRNTDNEHIEGKFFDEPQSIISPDHSATVVIHVIALREESEHMHFHFPRQNFYVRNVDSDQPSVIGAL
jgi:hypothetical protein